MVETIALTEVNEAVVGKERESVIDIDIRIRLIRVNDLGRNVLFFSSIPIRKKDFQRVPVKRVELYIHTNWIFHQNGDFTGQRIVTQRTQLVVVIQ